MTGLGLDDGIQQLLETQLDSFEKLEIVRLLRASGHAMSSDDLVAACRFPSQGVHEALANLEGTPLVAHDPDSGLVRLGAGSDDPTFEALMQLYEHDCHRVLSALSSLALARIRSMAARAFADALVIRQRRGRRDG